MEKTFQKEASISAILAGLSALAYAYYFIIAKNTMLYGLFLALSGLFALPVMVALFNKLKKVDEGFATLALVLGAVGVIGTLVHGAYDLANAINPPKMMNLDLPSQIDPRGLLAFGVMGLAIFKFSWLMTKDKYFPGGLVNWGYLSGTLLVVIYIARLTVLSPANPILLYPVLIEGFVVNPIWYIWLGLNLKK